MHRENCVKDSSGTTASKILKFSSNIGYYYLYRVRQNQHPHDYHSLYSSIVLLIRFFGKKFLRNYCTLYFEILYKYCIWVVVSCKRDSACWYLPFPLFVLFVSFSPIKFLSFCECQSLQILYIPTEDWIILCKRKQRCWKLFSFFPSHFHVKDFSGAPEKSLTWKWDGKKENLVHTLCTTTCIL